MGAAITESDMEVLRQLKPELPYDSVILFLGSRYF